MKLAVNRNKTVPALLSALACAAIWAHLDMSSYEPLLLGAFAALYFLFSAAAVCSGRKIMLPAAVLGFVFALFTLLGNLDVLAEQKTYVLWCMIRLFGFWSMYWAMLALIFRKLSSVSLMCDAASERSVRNCRRVFLGSFAALTAVYAIWWLYEFPGNTSPDSNSQIMQVTGLMPLRSNHPAVSTMFLGVIFNAGLKLFAGNQNSALALYTAIQLLIMAAIFAYAAECVYEMGLKKGAVYFVLAVYLLHPVYASYSVTVWKDVLFSGWITGFCGECCKRGKARYARGRSCCCFSSPLRQVFSETGAIMRSCCCSRLFLYNSTKETVGYRQCRLLYLRWRCLLTDRYFPR